MELDLKIQNIIDTDSRNSTQLSITHFFEVDDAALTQRRGKLFIVLSIQATENFDLTPAIKIFLDNIRDNYYRNTEETPLNSVEKAINRAYQLLLSIKSRDEKEILGSPGSHFKISFCTALLWNKVLYTSYIGKPTAYLIRGSGVRNIAGTSSGHEVWTSSSILDNEDIIVIGTESFAELFPPSEIISKLNEVSDIIKVSPNKNLIAATLLKITGETGGSKKSKLGGRLQNLYLKGTLSTGITKIKDTLQEAPKLSEKFKIYQKKKTAPISSISGILPTSQTNEPTIIETSKRIKLKRRTHVSLALTIGFVIITLISVTGYKIITQPKTKDNLYNDVSANNKTSISDHLSRDSESDSNPDLTVPKTDTSIVPILDADKSATPIKIKDIQNSGDGKVVVVDGSSKIIYTFNPQTKELKPLVNKLEGFELMRCDAKICSIYENNTVLILNTGTVDKTDRYLVQNMSGVNDVFPFAGKVYFLTRNDIYTMQLQTKTAAPTKWLAKTEDLTDPISFAIDSNVYVLLKGAVNKYFNGAKVNTYDISKYMSNPKQIEADAKKLYILDEAKRSVFVFEKNTMNLVKEVSLVSEADTDTPTKFAIIKTGTVSSVVYKMGNNLYQLPL